MEQSGSKSLDSPSALNLYSYPALLTLAIRSIRLLLCFLETVLESINAAELNYISRESHAVACNSSYLIVPQFLLLLSWVYFLLIGHNCCKRV